MCVKRLVPQHWVTFYSRWHSNNSKSFISEILKGLCDLCDRIIGKSLTGCFVDFRYTVLPLPYNHSPAAMVRPNMGAFPATQASFEPSKTMHFRPSPPWKCSFAPTVHKTFFGIDKMPLRIISFLSSPKKGGDALADDRNLHFYVLGRIFSPREMRWRHLHGYRHFGY